MARLKEKYLNEVVPGLQEQFKYTKRNGYSKTG